MMVGVLRFERRTSVLSGLRSNQLSYTPIWSGVHFNISGGWYEHRFCFNYKLYSFYLRKVSNWYVQKKDYYNDVRLVTCLTLAKNRKDWLDGVLWNVRKRMHCWLGFWSRWCVLCQFGLHAATSDLPARFVWLVGSPGALRSLLCPTRPRRADGNHHPVRLTWGQSCFKLPDFTVEELFLRLDTLTMLLED